MTAKKVRCNRWKECRSDDCPHYKSHPENPMCVPAYCAQGGESAWCIPVNRKPSPAKPEKIWVEERYHKKSKKWLSSNVKLSVGMHKAMLEDTRLEHPTEKFQLREYTAGKVLKD